MMILQLALTISFNLTGLRTVTCMIMIHCTVVHPHGVLTLHLNQGIIQVLISCAILTVRIA